MQTEEIKQRILAAIPDAEIKIEGEDCSFSVVVLSQEFKSVPVVKRQQTVLSAFADVLQSGELHALNVKAHTAEEWQSFQQTGLTQISL